MTYPRKNDSGDRYPGCAAGSTSNARRAGASRHRRPRTHHRILRSTRRRRADHARTQWLSPCRRRGEAAASPVGSKVGDVAAATSSNRFSFQFLLYSIGSFAFQSYMAPRSYKSLCVGPETLTAHAAPRPPAPPRKAAAGRAPALTLRHACTRRASGCHSSIRSSAAPHTPQ